MVIVVWMTGLPGSGKSTIAAALKEKISDAVILRMDEFRKMVTPRPSYSDPERELIYRALIYSAKTIFDLGHNVIIDATGNRRSWRQLARELIPCFIEVYLECGIDLCIEREQARVNTHAAPEHIYEKGKAGWPVPGVNVPYEKPEKPELTINTEKESPDEAVEKIMKLIKKMQGQV